MMCVMTHVKIWSSFSLIIEFYNRRRVRTSPYTPGSPRMEHAIPDGIPHPAPAYRTLVRTPSCSKSASRATTRSAASYSGGNPAGSGAPAR